MGGSAADRRFGNHLRAHLPHQGHFPGLLRLMQAILRSRVPAGRRKAGTPIRIEVSAPVSFTEAECTRDGKFDKDIAIGLALAEFTVLFGEPMIRMATAPRAYWTIEVI